MVKFFHCFFARKEPNHEFTRQELSENEGFYRGGDHVSDRHGGGIKGEEEKRCIAYDPRSAEQRRSDRKDGCVADHTGLDQSGQQRHKKHTDRL